MKSKLIGFSVNTGKSSKEFKSIQLKNSSLVVNFATELDEGFYMCQVSNGIGHGLKKIVHVNINGKYNICRSLSFGVN